MPVLRSSGLLVLTGLLALVILVPSAEPAARLAGAAPNGSDLEHNRQLLEVWRNDPEHRARLQQDLRAFASMPAAQQERIRQLDRDLYQLPPATRQHLLHVLERYAQWLERLSPEDRSWLESATGREERLQIVRAIRERQWIEHLPLKVRQQLEQAPEDRRSALLAELRKQERQQRQEWSRLHRPSFERQLRPTQLADFPWEVRLFVRSQLEPRLDADERLRLHQAEGKWPLLPRTLMDLSEKHLALPPLPGHLVRRYHDLPEQARLLLPPRHRPVWKKLEEKEGKWPDFALACTELMHLHAQGPVPALGASRPRELGQPTQDFLSQHLLRVLSRGETERLQAAEGKWPDYPHLLLELAHKHDLTVPGMSLPGPRELWNLAR